MLQAVAQNKHSALCSIGIPLLKLNKNKMQNRVIVWFGSLKHGLKISMGM